MRDWNNISVDPQWRRKYPCFVVVAQVTTGWRVTGEKMPELDGNMKFTELKGVGHSAYRAGFAYKGDDPEKGYVTHYAGPACDKTKDAGQWLFRQKRPDN